MVKSDRLKPVLLFCATLGRRGSDPSWHPLPEQPRNRDVIHPFDQKYGTDTGGYLGPEDLVKGRANDAFNNGYSAVAPSVFHEASRRWRETFPQFGQNRSLQFRGCGSREGPVSCLRRNCLPQVIGVELVRGVGAHRASKMSSDGAASIGQRQKFAWFKATAAKFQWPRTPLLVYLYNPFACSLIAQMAENLAASAAAGSGLVDLIYVNPTCADILSKQGLFAHLWTVRIPMDPADQKADPYGTTSDLVSAYRLK